jgi:RHS repeat-associated protein
MPALASFQLDSSTHTLTVPNPNPTVPVLWNRAVLEAVTATAVGPTIAARAYAIVHTAIYDAWAAYDPTAIHIQYDSFGNVISETHPEVEFRFGYTGREPDVETGLDFYRARYYDPAVGQFVSEDPIGFDASDANLYRYVFNSPTNLNDPDGEVVIPLGIGAGALLVGGAALLIANHQGQQALNHEQGSSSNAVLSNGLEKIEQGLKSSWEQLFGPNDLNQATTPPVIIPTTGGIPTNDGQNMSTLPGHGGTELSNVTDTLLGPTDLGAADGLSPQWCEVDIDPSTPVGRRGTGDPNSLASPIQVPPPTNVRTMIGDRSFSGHALDNMQAQGLTPSVVEDAIQNGVSYLSRDGRQIFYSPDNNVTVVIDPASGNVVTADFDDFR